MFITAEKFSPQKCENTNVIAKLHEVYHEMIYIYCAAHRLNLVVASYFEQVKSGSSVIHIYKSLPNIFNVSKNKAFLGYTPY